MWYEWRAYVRAAQRRRQAERELGRLRKKGQAVSPVVIEGRAIARTFWGKAWCDNLERYSDFANRLPRGRTYVRNGSVLDLRIAPGDVRALVSGSEIYRVAVKVSPVAKARWTSICRDCAGTNRLVGRAAPGALLHRRHGAHLPAADRAVSRACRDQLLLQLPRLGLDV